MSEPMIMYEDVPLTRYPIDGWKDSRGRIWNSEETARWANCTHRRCDRCGQPESKTWTLCSGCRTLAKRERHEAREKKPYDGSPVVEADGDRYFFSEDDLEAWLADRMDDGLARGDDPLLLFAIPADVPVVDVSIFDDYAPEDWDGEVAPEVSAALEALNEAIRKQGAISWLPGKIAVDPATLPWPPAEGGAE